jgi:hypothetical protein
MHACHCTLLLFDFLKTGNHVFLSGVTPAIVPRIATRAYACSTEVSIGETCANVQLPAGMPDHWHVLVTSDATLSYFPYHPARVLPTHSRPLRLYLPS